MKQRGGARNVKTHYGFINPQGEEVVIVNLYQFCWGHDLLPEVMYKVKAGTYGPSYKGWSHKEGRIIYEQRHSASHHRCAQA